MTAQEAVHFFMTYGYVCGPETSLLFEKPTADQLRAAVATAIRRGQAPELAHEAGRVIEECIGIRDPYQRIGLPNYVAASRRRNGYDFIKGQ
jgi:hypothetical protein